MLTKQNLLAFLKKLPDDTELDFILDNNGDSKIKPIHMITHTDTCMASGNEHVSVKIIFSFNP